jgi:hypothetical protein
MDFINEDLETIVEREAKEYSNRWGEDITIMWLTNSDQKTYAVLITPEPGNPILKNATLVILARIVGEYVLIEADNTDKPLVDALVHNGGIPREKIILRYQGETLPENISV